MKPNEGNGKRIVSVRVAPSLYERMSRAAKKEKLPLPDWMRDALLGAVRDAEGRRAG